MEKRVDLYNVGLDTQDLQNSQTVALHHIGFVLLGVLCMPCIRRVNI
jgi:hypothetical protein